jgi:hypothetical protein
MDKFNCPNGIINWLIASEIEYDGFGRLKIFDFFFEKNFF